MSIRFSEDEKEFIEKLTMVSGLSFTQARDFMEALITLSVIELTDHKNIKIPKLCDIIINIDDAEVNYNVVLSQFLNDNIQCIQTQSKTLIEKHLQEKIRGAVNKMLKRS